MNTVDTPPPSPGQHDVGVGVVGARPRGAPLDGVDLFAVSLQVVHARLLFHAPNLHAGGK